MATATNDEQNPLIRELMDILNSHKAMYTHVQALLAKFRETYNPDTLLQVADEIDAIADGIEWKGLPLGHQLKRKSDAMKEFADMLRVKQNQSSDEQDKLLREIFALHASHGIKALPYARMLLAKFLVDDHKAFCEVVDCDTRLKVADEAEKIVRLAPWSTKGPGVESTAGSALKLFADDLRSGVRQRGVFVHECTPDKKDT